jgi:penicillin-binding protein 1A
VLHGTARRAASAVLHGGRALPLGGKTGTTNDYKNAAFVGFAPAATPAGYALDHGYVVGAYVGYDDNRSMTRGRIRLQGSNGALPAWIGTVEGLARAGLVGEVPQVAAAEGEGPTILADRSLARIAVEPAHGLPAADGAATVLVRSAGSAEGPAVDVPRLDRPPRIAPGTEEALLERPEPPVLAPPEE